MSQVASPAFKSPVSKPIDISKIGLQKTPSIFSKKSSSIGENPSKSALKIPPTTNGVATV